MGKVILYNAISADGYIAGEHDETPWSDEEWTAFQAFIRTCDVCLLGRRTYEIMRADGQFIDGPRYIVVTNNTQFDSGSYEKISIRSANTVPDGTIIGVIGGAELNGSLASMQLIDEVVLDVEPVVLGGGKRLFGNHSVSFALQLLASRPIGSNTVQNHYRVVR